jgi:anti-anti-sigma factor
VIRPEFDAATVAVRPGVVLVEFTGDLDRDTAAEALDHLVTATAGETRHLILDLSQVVFMGSDGISLLIAAHRGCHGVRGALHVIGIAENRQVLRPLQLMNLVGELDIAEDLDAALTAIDTPAGADGPTTDGPTTDDPGPRAAPAG